LRLDECDHGLVGAWVKRQFAHGQHRRRTVELGLLFDERDRPDESPGELVAARSPEVGREHSGRAASGATSSVDANAQGFRVGQQAVDVGAPRARGVGDGAVERGAGSVPEGELGSGREIREVDQEICALGRRQHETLLRDRDGRLE